MFINLKATSISMHSSADLPDKKGTPRGRQAFQFSVHLDDGDHIDLETGEVFGGRFRKNDISASLTVGQAKTDEYYNANRMSYSEAIVSDDPMVSKPSEIYFTVFVPPDDFQELVNNVRNGLLPSTIRVELHYEMFDESSPMKYGWEPDGSGMKWRNRDKNNRHIQIQGISFDYDVLKPVDDEPGDVPKTESFAAEPANTHMRQVTDALGSLRTEIKTVLWGMVILVIGLAYYLKH